eukprot:13846730-Ditylum_brightwellii.AAC.1
MGLLCGVSSGRRKELSVDVYHRRERRPYWSLSMISYRRYNPDRIRKAARALMSCCCARHGQPLCCILLFMWIRWVEEQSTEFDHNDRDVIMAKSLGQMLLGSSTP